MLLATENAPEGKRSWYAMFPQLGAPIGFILSAGLFLILRESMTDADFLDYGWRIPFLISLALVAIGLYVRLKITETPEFRRAIEKQERVSVPIAVIFRSHLRSLVLGTIHRGRDLRALLSDDGIHAELGHHDRSAQGRSRQVSAIRRASSWSSSSSASSSSA